MVSQVLFVKKWIVIFTMFISASVSAQLLVSGTISDASTGEPLPGANIIEKGSTNGTISDALGKFSIKVSDGQSSLIFTFVGYDKIEEGLNNRSEINVIMSPSSQDIEELVVIGYGTMKKKDLTGSVSTIKPDDVQGMPVPRADLLLQGRASGVEVTQNSGAPGGEIRIRIRGVHSINSDNDPLVVIDGFPGGNLSDVNPNDIERIDVLKDASALAIYGARATNGVIIITTKKGKTGEGKIDFTYSHSVQDISKKIDVLGSQDFGYFINESYNNDGDPRPYPVVGSRRFPIKPEDIDYNVDWHDLVYKQGQVDEYQLSFSGGSEKIKYYLSGNYYDQSGVIPNSAFQRFSARINVNAEVKKWLTTGINLNASRRNFTGETGFWNGQGVSGNILGYSPLFEPKDTLGNWQYDKLNIPADNPLAIAEIPVPVSELKLDYLNPDFYAQFTILPSLTFRMSAGFETAVRRHGKAWLQESIQGATKVSPAGNAGEADFSNYQDFRFVNENVLSFDKHFNDNHHLSAIAGYSWETFTRESFSGHAYGFISDAFMFEYLNMGAADEYSSIGSGKITNEIESYFGRINYNLMDRYSLTVNGRVDGSSVFAVNNKNGFFPSGAFAWKIHNETFMESLDFLSELKARVSYGLVGNASIGSYNSLAKLQITQGVFNNNQKIGVVIPVSVSNNELSWESTKQLDVGIDIGFMKNRITLTADYYSKVTYGLLFEKNFPGVSGFARGLVNIGEVGNKGFEFTVHSVNISAPFKWETDFNFSANKNEILRLADEQMQFVSNATLSTALSHELNILQVGQPISTFYGNIYEGVYTDADEAAANNAQVGNAKYADTDGNGIFEEGVDRVILGSGFPDYIWGMNNTFNFKGFELGIFIQASMGAEIYNLSRQRIESMNPGSNISQYAWDNRSYYDKDMEEWIFTEIPKASAYNKMLPTDRFIEDGSFIRLQNLTLGYTLPTKWLNKAHIREAKVYFSAQNLFLISNYKGYDPEVSRYKNSDESHGIDDGTYPNVKGLTFGVKLGF